MLRFAKAWWRILFTPNLSEIRLLVLDVDGVLTDGGLWFDQAGRLQKRFDVRDGLGIRLLQDIGITIAFLRVFFVVFQISLGLCSTHPSLGKYCLNSFCDEYIFLPDRLNNTALLDVVP